MGGVDAVDGAAGEPRASPEPAVGANHGSGDHAGPERPFTLGVLSLFVGGFYFGDILTGIAATAARHGAQVLAVQTADPWARDGSQPAPYLPLACDHLDGVLVIADALRDEDRRHLAALGKPVVTISAHNPLPRYPSVFPDNRGGAAEAVRHLLSHGHRRIGFVGWLEQADILLRYEGYRSALLDAGISPDPSLVFTANDNIERGGREAAAALLAAGIPCTAVLAATDLNALGLMEALAAAGQRVPEDLAVIGFDDIEMAQLSMPSLSSVRQRFGVLGTTAAEYILNALAGDPVPGGPILLPTVLICRHSCGCAEEQALPTSASDLAYGTGTWRATLATELALRVVWPSRPHEGILPEAVWPGVATIIAGLEAAVLGVAGPPSGFLRNAWQDACLRAANAEVLQTTLALLEQAGKARLHVERVAGHAVGGRLDGFLAAAREHIVQCSAQRGVRASRTHEAALQQSYHLGMTMFRPRSGKVADLEWAGHTALRRCCLALWEDDVGPGATRVLVVHGSYTAPGLLGEEVLVGTRLALEAFPPAAFLHACVDAEGSQTVLVVPLGTTERAWGYLAVVGPAEGQFYEAHNTLRHWAALCTAALEHEALGREAAQQRRLLAEREQRFRALVEQASDLVLILAGDGVIRYASPSHERLLGVAVVDLEGTPIASRLHPDDMPGLRKGLAAAARQDGAIRVGELHIRHADGAWRTLETLANDRTADHAVQGIILNSRDITERKVAEAALLHLALHDSLTGLPNRALLHDRLDTALRSAERAVTPLALCLLDLDRFKEVNDTLGHQAGDRLLQEVAGRVRSALRASDTVARLGGDEFAILLPGANRETAIAVVGRICRALSAPLELKGYRPDVAGSIGIALFPEHGSDPSTLLAHADVAMYAAKHAGGGYALYDTALDTRGQHFSAHDRGS